MTTLNRNEALNGLEISFTEKPDAQTLTALKENGFRWHKQKKMWYAHSTEKRVIFAESLIAVSTTGSTQKSPKNSENKPHSEKPEAVNKYGVRVGDLFRATWGYDQTNNDFFQVIALVGESSVRVREVDPIIERTEAVGPMAEDRVIRNTHELLPPARFSVFIHDQEAGDLKRLKSYMQDGSRPQFKLSSFCDAYKVESDVITVYESWYA